MSLDGSIGYWDTGESQVVPWIFGIAHPTGFPAFTLAAGAFAHVFAIGSVAWRIALFSAIAMSLVSWAIYRALRELRCDYWIALGSGWTFSFGEIAWTRGTRAEVHALAACFAALTLLFAIKWYLNGDRRAFVLGALFWGLAVATHPIASLLAPALIVLLCAGFRRIHPRGLAAALLVFACGAGLYAYLPLRSAIVTQERLDPTRALGIPPGSAFWDMNHPASRDGFVRFMSGSDYGVGGAFVAAIKPETYRDGVPPFFIELWREFTVVGLVLAAGGFFALVRRDRWLGISLVLAAAAPAIFALSYSTEADTGRYYLLPFIVAAIAAGYGAEAAARSEPTLKGISLVAMPAIALSLLIFNRGTFSQPKSTGAAGLIQTVVARTPDGAVLLAPWIDSTALAYAAYVDRSLGKRIVVSAWLSDEAPRVPGWIARGRKVYVVGEVFGSVPGYKLVRVASSPDVFRIVRQ